MIDEARTYFPPTWEMTSAYSFSAPMAVMVADDPVPAGAVPVDVVPVDVPPAAPDAAGEDEQALASRAAARGSAATRRPGRVRMTLVLQVGEPQGGVS
jgi:hypothetical protein